MEYKLTIPFVLPGLNEAILKARTGPHAGAKHKREWQSDLHWLILMQLPNVAISGPVTISYHWVEPSRRRDKDNISGYGRKLIQDALVKAGVLKNDGWNDIVNSYDSYGIDRKHPRIEVTICEVAE